MLERPTCTAPLAKFLLTSKPHWVRTVTNSGNSENSGYHPFAHPLLQVPSVHAPASFASPSTSDRWLDQRDLHRCAPERFRGRWQGHKIYPRNPELPFWLGEEIISRLQHYDRLRLEWPGIGSKMSMSQGSQHRGSPDTPTLLPHFWKITQYRSPRNSSLAIKRKSPVN